MSPIKPRSTTNPTTPPAVPPMMAPKLAGLLVLEVFGVTWDVANTVTVPVDMMVEPSDVNALVKTLVEATEPLDVPLVSLAVLLDPGFEAGLVSPVEHEVENNVAIAEVEVVVRVTGTGT